MEIEEVVRRWQVRESQRAIAGATGLARETVKKYLAAAIDLGLSATGPPPSEAQLLVLRQLGVVAAQPVKCVAPQVAMLEPCREQIARLPADHAATGRAVPALRHSDPRPASTSMWPRDRCCARRTGRHAPRLTLSLTCGVRLGVIRPPPSGTLWLTISTSTAPRVSCATLPSETGSPRTSGSNTCAASCGRERLARRSWLIRPIRSSFTTRQFTRRG
jgi:hypothetical protein